MDWCSLWLLPIIYCIFLFFFILNLSCWDTISEVKILEKDKNQWNDLTNFKAKKDKIKWFMIFIFFLFYFWDLIWLINLKGKRRFMLCGNVWNFYFKIFVFSYSQHKNIVILGAEHNRKNNLILFRILCDMESKYLKILNWFKFIVKDACQFRRFVVRVCSLKMEGDMCIFS